MSTLLNSNSSSQAGDFIVFFAQWHETFRQAELEALAELSNIKLEWVYYSDKSPFSHIRLSPASRAHDLVSRSILVKSIFELWAQGTTYDEVHSDLRANLSRLWKSSYKSASFKFEIESFQGKRDVNTQRSLVESFSYLGLDGPIRMKNPDLTFGLLEEFPRPAFNRRDPNAVPDRLFLGLSVGQGDRRCVDKYDLKKRPYIGTTSMDAELSLITANMALCAPGRLAYDPFVGTGSFLVACAHFGSMVFGSDIDGRQIRGKKGRNVKENFKHYGLETLFGDCFTADLTNSPVRDVPWLDSIICDPPYGVREGLKVLGNRDPTKPKEPLILDGVLRHTQPDYVPPKRPYSFNAMMSDILDFSVANLREGGRLAMWMPVVNEDLKVMEKPSHPALEMAACCVQTFSSWSRQLLVYKRRRDAEVDLVAWEQRVKEKMERKDEFGRSDDLNAFRRKYFLGFKPTVEDALGPSKEGKENEE